MSAVCDSCGKSPTPKGGLAGFKLTAMIEGKAYAIMARLCSRGCAQAVRDWKVANRTTEPPEIKTQWGGEPLRPLRTGEEEAA